MSSHCKISEKYNWYDPHQKHLRGELGGVCARLIGADLSGADLSWANLNNSDLTNARLIGADLSDADLSDADLSGADLSGADLSGADLRHADLSGARTKCGAILTHAAVYSRGHGECGRQLLAIRHIDQDLPDLFWCGCFHGDEVELRRYIELGKERHRHSRTVALNCVLDLLDLDGGVR